MQAIYTSAKYDLEKQKKKIFIFEKRGEKNKNYFGCRGKTESRDWHNEKQDQRIDTSPVVVRFMVIVFKFGSIVFFLANHL